jgi:hypothetical protein
MSAMTGDVFDGAMHGLEAGFRVFHIATFDLRTCAADDDMTQILDDPELAGFDQIPVQRGSKIVGVLERKPERGKGEVAAHMRLIEPLSLVSAQAPLRSFIPHVAQKRYWMVVSVTGINGIVTRSDLLKLPVRLHAFTMVTHLEMVMADVIRTLRGSESGWLALLTEGRRSKISEKQERLQEKGLDPPLLELTDFCDKRVAVAKLLSLGDEFIEQLEGIEQLRNSVAHAATFINDAAGVEEFVQRVSAAERWIAELPSLAHDASR